MKIYCLYAKSKDNKEQGYINYQDLSNDEFSMFESLVNITTKEKSTLLFSLDQANDLKDKLTKPGAWLEDYKIEIYSADIDLSKLP